MFFVLSVHNLDIVHKNNNIVAFFQIYAVVANNPAKTKPKFQPEIKILFLPQGA